MTPFPLKSDSTSKPLQHNRDASFRILRGWMCVRACVLVSALSIGGCSVAPTNEPVVENPVPVADRQEKPVVPSVTPSEAVETEPEPVPVVLAELVDEDNIFFESGSTEVSARGRAKLQVHAERLKSDPDAYVTLVGHTDDLGSRNYNLALAEQRILSVSKRLRKQGVRSRQIRRYRGDAEKVPNTCKSAECRQKMRRVELVYAQE